MKKRSWKEHYKVTGTIGTGGNATVYEVKDEDENIFAMKLLMDISDKNTEGKIRFIDEIKIMTENRGMLGVMPIIESSIEDYWYVMPVAEPILKRLTQIDGIDDKVQEIIIAMKELTEILAELHKKQIAHRDIKPANLYYLDGHYVFGDFGLAVFPEHVEDLTNDKRNLGAKFTIAPEMMRYPKEADGFKADVYSMGKTLWMLFTEDTLGFEGTYNPLDKTHGLRYRDKLKKVHLAELEQLIKTATSNGPDDRPTAKDMYQQVMNWINIVSDFHLSQKSDWDYINKLLFGNTVPQSSSWSGITNIFNVLDIVVHAPAFNHTFLPDGGGLDLTDIKMATDPGWIDLIFGSSIYRIKPEKLYFERFIENQECNYFRLELSKEKPVFATALSNDEMDEFLTEDFPGHYVSPKDFQYGVYDYETGEPLPKGARQLHRYYDGVFLIVNKFSIYNTMSSTYDGRHADCDNAELRDYIEQLISVSQLAKRKGYNLDAVLNDKRISANPFKKEKKAKSEDYDTDYYEQEKIEKYIKENYTKWEFPVKERSNDNIDKCKITYFFEVKPSIDDNFFSHRFIEQKELVLNRNGTITIESKEQISQRIIYSDLERIRDDLREINLFIRKKLEDDGFKVNNDMNKNNSDINIFDISVLKGNVSPEHLFTLDEIKKEMTKADDRVTNVLVIDADGYAHVIPHDDNVLFYPVRLESWGAGGKYVGKYSNLDDAERAYHEALYGWEYYLNTKRGKTVWEPDSLDTIPNLLKEIKSYYNREEICDI